MEARSAFMVISRFGGYRLVSRHGVVFSPIGAWVRHVFAQQEMSDDFVKVAVCGTPHRGLHFGRCV